MLQIKDKPRMLLAWFSMACISGFVILSTILLLSNPDIQVLQFSLSRYGFAPNGFLLTIGLLLMGTAEIIIGLYFYTSSERGFKWLSFFLSVMGITAIITGILPMDIEPAKTVPGIIHIYAAGIQFVLFPASSGLFGICKIKTRLGRFSVSISVTAITILPFITLTILSENPRFFPVYGLIQKVYILLIVTWLAAISILMLKGQD